MVDLGCAEDKKVENKDEDREKKRIRNGKSRRREVK